MSGKENLTKTDTHKNAMIAALTKTLGIVTAACQKVGISRETHYEWMREDPEYKAKIDDIKNIALDYTEGKMFKAIKDGDTGMIKFHLATVGKDRGYTERKELTGKDGNPLEFLHKTEIDL